MPKYSVSRSVVIERDPISVFEMIADYGTWTTWSPWLCAEPDTKVTVSDNPKSVGSTYSWEGELTGVGELEHLQLEPGQSIRDEIRFKKPFKSVSNVGFDFAPLGSGTKVTWTMAGSLPWFMFWMKPMMQSFIGMDYTRGLSMLKEWAETGTILSDTQSKGIQSIGPLRMAGVNKECDFDRIAEATGQDMQKATEVFQRHGLPTDKGTMSVYHKFDIKNLIMNYTCGFIVDEPVDIPGINNWEIPEVQALRVDHVGSYQNLGNSWSAANQIARYKKLKQSKVGAFEIYRNELSNTEPANLITEIYLPLK